MATPLTDSINALTTYANEVTGASDTTLSDAVGTLVAGYGGGGSSLLRSVVPSTNSNECVIEINNDWLENYNFFTVKCHFCYSSSGNQYVYFLWNTKEYGDPYYGSSTGDVVFDTFFNFEVKDDAVALPQGNSIRQQGSERPVLLSGNYICVKLYRGKYTEGAKFELYGMH